MDQHKYHSLRILTSLAEFESLACEWNQLLEQTTGAGNIFLSWEWLFAWSKSYLAAGQLHLLLLYQQNGRLSGIAPFYVRKVPLGMGFAVREMRFLGSEEVSSCYLDIIAVEKDRPSVIKEIYDYLHQDGKRSWDILLFPEAPAESPTIDLWQELTEESGQVIEIASVTACPIIELPDTPSALLAGFSRNERYNLQRKQKTLAAAGTVEYIRLVSPHDIEKELETFIHLHEMRWNSKGGHGVFAQARYAAFHRDVCQRLGRKGLVSLDFLLLNGEKIAGIYGFVYAGTYWFYLPGFNPDMVPKASPGILLLFHRIQEAVEEGCQRVDLLRGATPYKMAWANGVRRSLTIRHYNRSLSAVVFKSIESIKTMVKIVLR